MASLKIIPVKSDFPNSINVKNISRIFDALGVDQAMLVGGCVRNILLNREISDVDIATSLLPSDVLSRLDRAGIKTIPTGLKHGTVTAVIDSVPYEMTTLRVDLKTDGRHADVQFTDDWRADALRRDFYINALYADRDGKIYDPTGYGLEDIAARRVRFIGDASARIKEDYLRILRFYRFSAYFSVNIDFDGALACEQFRDGLSTLSSERIWSELKKILVAPRALSILEAMDQAKILAALSQNFHQYIDFKYIFEKMERLSVDPVLRFSSLLPFSDGLSLELIDAECQRFRLSNAEAQILSDLQQDEFWHFLCKINVDESSLSDVQVSIKKWAYGCGLRRAGTMMAIAYASGLISTSLWTMWEAWDKTLPQFPLTGSDLLKRGFKANAELGRHLKAIEAAWVQSGFDDQVAWRALDGLKAT